MKKSAVILAFCLAGAVMLTGCSEESTDTLAQANGETKAQWGLTFYETTAEEESEASQENETESETVLTEVAEGVMMMELQDVELQAVSSVNVRSGPGSDYDKLGGLAVGEIVSATGICDNEWVQIDFNGETGYVSGDYLETTDEELSLEDLIETVKNLVESSESEDSDSESEDEDTEETAAAEGEEDAEGTTAWAVSAVNVRAGAGTQYDVLGFLKTDESVTVLDTSNEYWWKIDYNGQEGYVSSSYLTTEEPE